MTRSKTGQKLGNWSRRLFEREIDNVPYNSFAMKEPDYNMKLMSTYGSLTVDEGGKQSVRYQDGKIVKFEYTKNFFHHFK